MELTLARNWWLLVLRGVLAIAFGVIAFLAPGAALLAIAIWFGACPDRAAAGGPCSLWACSALRPA